MQSRRPSRTTVRAPVQTPVKASVQALVAAGLLVSGLSACGPLGIRRGNALPGTRRFEAAQASLDSSTAVAGGLATLATTGTAEWGCTYDAGGGNTSAVSDNQVSADIINTLLKFKANTFTLPSAMYVRAVKIHFRKLNGPVATFIAELRTTSSGTPTSTVLATSQDYAASTPGPDVALGLPMQIDLLSPILMTPAAYALTLRATSITTITVGVNDLRWVATNTDGCTGFDTYLFSTDSGATWGAGNNNGVRRQFFTLVGDVHAPSGKVTWLSGAFENAIWDLSTFTMGENGLGNGGTITYDIGAGDSSTTPSYSLTGLTLAQVKASSSVRGRYFYLRANLSVSAPFFDSATLSGGSIEAN